MQQFMQHLAFLLENAVYGFEFYMVWYFGPALVLLVLGITGSASWLFRSKKPILIAATSLLIVWGAYGLCDWSRLDWKLYCYGMYGQFHIPTPYADDLWGETKMLQDMTARQHHASTVSTSIH